MPEKRSMTSHRPSASLGHARLRSADDPPHTTGLAAAMRMPTGWSCGCARISTGVPPVGPLSAPCGWRLGPSGRGGDAAPMAYTLARRCGFAAAPAGVVWTSVPMGATSAACPRGRVASAPSGSACFLGGGSVSGGREVSPAAAATSATPGRCPYSRVILPHLWSPPVLQSFCLPHWPFWKSWHNALPLSSL